MCSPLRSGVLAEHFGPCRHGYPRTGSVSCARRRRQQRTLKQSRKVTSRAVVSACSSGAVGSFSNKLSGRQERLQMILYPGSTTTTTCCMTCWVSPPHLLHDLTFVRECPSLFAPRPSASCIEEHAALRSPVLPGRCLGADRQPAGGARHAAARGSQPDDGVQRWQGWQRWRGSASGQDEAGAREGADPGGASPASRASPCLAAEPCHRSRLDVATACGLPSPCLPPPTSAASATRSLPALTAHRSPAGGRCGQGQGDPSLRADGAAAP